MEQKRIKVSEVVFRQDLYPRIKTSAETVQKYAEDLDVLPPIKVNQHNELIDGWHRWTAHRKMEAETIPVEIIPTASDAELLELAIETNATHGLQLSQEDKRTMARNIYHATPERERDAKKKHLAKILSVSERAIRDWLGRIDKDAKEARNQRIFDLWMQCYEQKEIAELAGISAPQVTEITSKFGIGNLAKTEFTAAEHASDFDPPIYNIWKRQEKTGGLTHFGNSEQTWVDNLLYLYTSPFDIVVDPFAGSGSTADVCRKRYRRFWASDRKPVVERQHEIRQHDLIADTGAVQLPALSGRWKDVKLVYLDPPYWKQAEGQYSKDPTDLANMPLEKFNQALSGIVNGFAAKMSKGSYIALIIQPTQWKADNRQFTDHIADMLKLVKLPVNMRYSVPYESQQCTAQMVEWAKEHKRCLVLTREIVVWEMA